MVRKETKLGTIQHREKTARGKAKLMPPKRRKSQEQKPKINLHTF